MRAEVQQAMDDLAALFGPRQGGKTTAARCVKTIYDGAFAAGVEEGRRRDAAIERRAHAMMAELMRLERLAPLRSVGKCTELLETPIGWRPCGNPSYELHRDEPLCMFHIYDAREAAGESVYGNGHIDAPPRGTP
jgi:hypothetical protein